MKKVLLIINAKAGTAKAQEDLYDIIRVFSVNDHEVTVYPIVPDKGLSAEQIVVEVSERFDLVACYGGDGTLHYVVNGYMFAQRHIPVGYFPAGSTNDFAKTMGIPTHIVENTLAMVAGKTFSYDVGKFNQDYFNYVAAFGAFTSISYNTSQDIKNVIGHAAYVLNGFLTLGDHLSMRCKMRVEHDGTIEEKEYIYGSVSNATSIGGFKLMEENRVEMDDGLMEVMLVQAPPTVLEMQQIIGGLLTSDTNNPYIDVFQTNRVIFTSLDEKPAEWTLDGEFGGAPEQVEIQTIPGAIPILIP